MKQIKNSNTPPLLSVLYPKFNTDPGSQIRIPFLKPATYPDLSFLNKFETDFRNQIPPQLSVLYPKFDPDPDLDPYGSGSRFRLFKVFQTGLINVPCTVYLRIC